MQLMIKTVGNRIECPECKEAYGNVSVKVDVGIHLLEAFILPGGEVAFTADSGSFVDCPVVGLECSNCGWDFDGPVIAERR